MLPGLSGWSPVEFHRRQKRLGNGLNQRILDASEWMYATWWTPRSCPAIIFLWEGMAKVLVLFLISKIVCNGSTLRDAVDQNEKYATFLFVLTTASLVYEMGQLEEAKWDVVKHFTSTWNRLDACSFTLLICAFAFYFLGQDDVSRMLLSISAIPLSSSILQYFSLVRSLGELVILIFAMLNEIFVFLFVYFTCLVGFGITFLGMFYGGDGFSDPSETFLTLYQAALGAFDFNIFNASSSITYSSVGLVILVIFITLTAIILLNLLIARMSNTYQKIDDKAREEWSFFKVCQFALLVTIIFFLFVYSLIILCIFFRQKRLSNICCSTSEVLCACCLLLSIYLSPSFTLFITTTLTMEESFLCVG